MNLQTRLKQIGRIFRECKETPGIPLALTGIGVCTLSLMLSARAHLGKEIVGTLLGSGVTLIAMGINEALKYRSSTTEVELRKVLEALNWHTVRLYVEVYNKGSVTVKDAKAVLEVLDPQPYELAKHLVSCGTDEEYLVNRVFPEIKGDLLPWSVPEKPIPRPVKTESGVTTTDYVHITSISPGQRVRAVVLDATKTPKGWEIKIFSEYGVAGPAEPAPRYPRACLRFGNGLNKLRLRVTVYGENLRRPEWIEMNITEEELENVLLERVRRLAEIILDKHNVTGSIRKLYVELAVELYRGEKFEKLLESCKSWGCNKEILEEIKHAIYPSMEPP